MHTAILVSSDIASAAYDEEAKTLDLEFCATGTYRYHDIPIEIFNAIVATSSPGKFFLQNIKGKFRWDKLT